jgi:hypothetical protein
MARKWIARVCGYGTALVLLALWLLLSTAFGQHLRALNSRSIFEIPPQPLPSALLRYTEQSGVHVTSSAGLIENKHSRGVAGHLNARDALLKLLEGTTLGFETIDGNSVVILPERTTLNPRPGEKRALSISEGGAAQVGELAVIGSLRFSDRLGPGEFGGFRHVATSSAQEPLLDRKLLWKIPPQPLPSALAQYAEQSGVQVTSSAELVEKKVTRAVCPVAQTHAPP